MDNLISKSVVFCLENSIAPLPTTAPPKKNPPSISCLYDINLISSILEMNGEKSESLDF